VGKKANLSWILYPDFYDILAWLVLGKYLILETFYFIDVSKKLDATISIY